MTRVSGRREALGARPECPPLGRAGIASGQRWARRGHLRSSTHWAGCPGGCHAQRDRRPDHLGGRLAHPRDPPRRLDGQIAADPRIFDAVTPWTHLPRGKDVKVVILVSEFERLPGAGVSGHHHRPSGGRPVGRGLVARRARPVGRPAHPARGERGARRRKARSRRVAASLYSVLKAQGNPVSLDVMPNSSHAWLAGRGWDVFLAAFPKAAAQD